METTNGYLVATFKLLGALGLLIFGMKMMSDALQKMAGSQLRHVLGVMTTNRFMGVLTGVLVTVTVQSSSATTVMTVSFVNAELLSLTQAISIIMGANIGTTLTSWIMSTGFSYNITDFVWPAFVIAIFLLYKKKFENIADFIFGVAFMFFSLGVLSSTGKEMDLANNQMLVDFFASFDSNSYWSIILFLIIGTILTCIVQSSAALMAITMVLCTSGVLSIHQGIALVMGENIGTTMTANLAALTGNTQGKRAALAHLLFNVFGVVWILCVFYPFVNMACSFVGINPMAETQDPMKLSFALASFHSAFNLINTFVLIWFVPQIGQICRWLIKTKETVREEDFRLRYIQGGLMQTPEISVLQAQKEVAHFAERIQRMFGLVRELLDEKDKEKFAKLYQRIEKYEGIADNMEMEIAGYLEHVGDAHLSDETKAKIRAMMREISEIESIGDACCNMARLLNRKHDSSEDFAEMQRAKIHEMMQLVDESLTQMNFMLKSRREELNMERTILLEERINNLRNQLKRQNTENINEHLYNYAIGMTYIDIINECEMLGDYVVNVVEARLKNN